MANARINLKTIDYYKFRKLVIDGNRDEYNSCSKEVRALCDNVQTFNFRDDEFDEEADRGRFDEICCYYRQILNGKRINPIDMRIKSGWWGDQKGASTYSIGKIKPAALKELLLSKTKDWAKRNNYTDKQITALQKKIDGPGIFVFKHRERQCFQYVGRAQKVFANCAEKLKLAYEGKSLEPLAALFLITLANDWEFYFNPILANDDERLLRILENDIILRHDCIWPHGLNFKLQIDSLLEVSEFRKSCVRYNWPPPTDDIEPAIDLNALRSQLEDLAKKETEELEPISAPVTLNSSTSNSRRSSTTGADDAAFDALPPSPTLQFPDSFSAGERPASPLSVISAATYTVDSLIARSDEAKKPVRRTPKMGINKGKENIRLSKENPRTNAITQKTPPPSGKHGLMNYPLDEAMDFKQKGDEKGADENEEEKSKEGLERTGSDDTDANDCSDNSRVERPTALPVSAHKLPAPSSPRKSRPTARKIQH